MKRIEFLLVLAYSTAALAAPRPPAPPPKKPPPPPVKPVTQPSTAPKPPDPALVAAVHQVIEKINAYTQHAATQPATGPIDAGADEAMTTLTLVPLDIQQEPAFAEQFASAIASLHAAAERQSAQAQRLIEQNEIVRGAVLLRHVAAAFPKDITGHNAAEKLAEVQLNPDVVSAVRMDVEEATLAQARWLMSAKLPLRAFALFGQAAGTDSKVALSAKAERAQFLTDPKLRDEIERQAATNPQEREAVHLLLMARNLLENNRPDPAKTRYAEIMKKFPGTYSAYAAEHEMAQAATQPATKPTTKPAGQ